MVGLFFLAVIALLIVGSFIIVKAVKAHDIRVNYALEIERIKPKAIEILNQLDPFFYPDHRVSRNDLESFLNDNREVISVINSLNRKDKPFCDIFERNDLQRFVIKMDDSVLEARRDENNRVFDKAQRLKELSSDVFQTNQRLTAPSHYFSHSEMEMLIPSLNEIQELVNSLKPKYAKFVNSRAEYLASLKRIIAQRRQEHNEEFERRELTENKNYFDTVLGKYPLDTQQREAIVKLEDNCLVISSAGSGKTSTSIAKVKYLLDKCQMKKEEILVMSFNNKTAEEFRAKLNIPGVACRTFHAEALHIIADVEGHQPAISDPKDHLLTQCHYVLENENRAYKTAITNYVTKIASLMKREHEYAEAKDYYQDRAKYGIVSPYLDMDGKPIYTKSEEERRICIWLSEHDVKFRYEEPYPFPTFDSNHRQYKPDFTIHYQAGGIDKVAFLEHFGIDANGNVPLWFGDGNGGYNIANTMYHAGINWKRSLHQYNGTTLLETESSQFSDGTVFLKLENQLRSIRVPIRPLTEDERHAKIFNRDTNMEENVLSLLSSIINLVKSNGKSYVEVLNNIQAHEEDDFVERCRFLLFEIAKPLHEKYEEALRARNEKDFTDLIQLATNYCNTGRWRSPFKYIIVDEFQDISTSRYQFIQSLRQKNPLTKTFLVGDDWQSIYRFAGSDLNLFQHVEDYFGYTERCKIETTYRFGNPLVDASSEFILKNPCQVQKMVRPYSQHAVTKISFIPFERNKEGSYLDYLVDTIKEIPKNESIMLIARYNKDVNVIPKGCRKQNPNSKKVVVTLCNRQMTFMSVHSAKGLEEDHVILLNCSQDGGGFPSRIADDPILGYLLSTPDNYDYSEERRLFYVAITRAKKNIHVLYNKNMPSFFVAEMTIGQDAEDMVCPVCKKGLLKAIKEEQTANGRMYRNYACSNSIAGCRFFWRIFYNNNSEITIQYHQQFDRYF